MARQPITFILSAAWLLLAASGGRALADDESSQFFEAKVRPCSQSTVTSATATARNPKGKLRLDTRDGLIRGGETAPAVVPGEPELSLLIRAVRYKDPTLQMPPDGRLSDRQIADLEAWVKMGAPDPRVLPPKAEPTTVPTTIDYAAARTGGRSGRRSGLTFRR